MVSRTLTLVTPSHWITNKHSSAPMSLRLAATPAQAKNYIFTETGGTWGQSDTLVASDPATDDFFGAAVARDGPTVLVSTPHPVINGNPYQGAAYFFERLMDDAR